jgi:hypothetical protein
MGSLVGGAEYRGSFQVRVPRDALSSSAANRGSRALERDDGRNRQCTPTGTPAFSSVAKHSESLPSEFSFLASASAAFNLLLASDSAFATAPGVG